MEHDPEEIWQSVVYCLDQVCERNKLTKDNVRSIGITNQRETTVAFSRTTGKPYHNALVWLDQRTAHIVAAFKHKNNGNADAYRNVCGLPINTYFSAVKMRWLLDNVQLDKNDLVFGTIDTWLVSKLTSCLSIATDSSNASRTMLMDINTLEWSDYMLNEFEIDKSWLP